MKKPVVLVFSGLDPTGGAGIKADLEALIAVGCHPLPIVTALTVQDLNTVYKVVSVESSVIESQAKALFKDFSIAAVKIGLLGSSENAIIISRILSNYSKLPIILDPVLYSGGGTSLADEGVIEAIITHLLPITFIATPNITEAKTLAKQQSIFSEEYSCIADALLKTGCHSVLITSTESGVTPIQHPLFINGASSPLVFSCERLEHIYHGSGCTLAASLAGFIANGINLEEACKKALNYTFQTLKHAYVFGNGQRIPNRFFF